MPRYTEGTFDLVRERSDGTIHRHTGHSGLQDHIVFERGRIAYARIGDKELDQSELASLNSTSRSGINGLEALKYYFKF